jgi:subtilisin family serine protease
VISAIAAGNSGPGLNTVESPGAAARALTAGAVTVGHFIGVNVTVGGSNFAAAIGQFGPSAAVSGPLTVVSSNGCSPLSGLSAAIALIPRGVCTFSTKIRNAQSAGAVGVVIRNNVGGPPIAMAKDGTPNQPTIPGVMVSLNTGTTLTGLGGSATTINAAKTYVQDLATSNVLAGFSSRGPTDVDFRVKPDVTSPGVNVLSSIPGSGAETCVPAFPAPCWAFFQGTSMATPHLAGSAAVVLARHPTWPSWAVRSAIVNTADENVHRTSDGGCCDTNGLDVGSGRENLNSAVHASLALDPVSVSFGAVPSGSGQTKSMDVTVMNLTSSPLAVPAPTITGATGTGVTYSVNPAPFSLPAGGTATITVTMSAQKGAGLGAHQAILRFGGLAHAVLFTWIK